MSGRSFHEAVEASFDTVAVQVDGAEKKPSTNLALRVFMCFSKGVAATHRVVV